MAIFKKWVLTDAAKALITKVQTGKGNIHFSKACYGDGNWTLKENIENTLNLKNVRKTVKFSHIYIPDGNPSTVVLETVLTNKDNNELFFITELGVYAVDPDLGEILYCIAVTDEKATYLPAYNGLGISSLIDRINIEVADSANVTIDSTGALVSAKDFSELKKKADPLIIGSIGGTRGQVLRKVADKDYEIGWGYPIFIAPKNEYPPKGDELCLYVDRDTSKIYVWENDPVNGTGKYKPLALGADAAQIIQEQVSENKRRIVALEKNFTEISISVPGNMWKKTVETNTDVYTNEIVVAGMTADTAVTLWPKVISTAATNIIAEKKAQSVFFAKGVAATANGKLILKCYGKKPAVDFGLIIQGG